MLFVRTLGPMRIATLKWRSHSWLRSFSLLFLLSFPLPAFAGTLSGVVTNGTNGKPVPHADVTLISLAGGMQELTTTQTDAGGHYHFDRSEIGQGPMLVRVNYQNVSYHQAAPPGRNAVDMTVYDAGAPSSAAQVSMRTIIFQPSGQRLLVGEEYVITNNTKPPATYANSKGTFEFAVPDGAQLGQVSASSPGGMPTTQSTIDKSKNHYAIDFPLKPGDTNIRVAYDVPYDPAHTTVRPASLLPAARVMLAAPQGVQISGDGFAPSGSDQGFTLMTRENVPAGTAFGVTLSGTAPTPPPGQGQAADAGQPASGGRDAQAANVQVLSPRLSSFQYIVLGGMGLFFLAGFFFLMRQQRAVPVTPNGAYAVAVPPVASGKKSRARENPAERTAYAPPAASAHVAPGHPVGADPSVRPQDSGRPASSGPMDLADMKETLFRLEFRRQAGTITEQDYAQARSLVEAAIRDFVRG